MEMIVQGPNKLLLEDKEYICAIGASGITADKHEGDKATPRGTWPLRMVYYRPDRLPNGIITKLHMVALTPDDGWCDDANDPNYNKHVKLPYPAHTESLWRDDEIYDIIVPLGYNDEPAIPGKGSAIFLHIAREGFTPTEGCVALSKDDLLEILASVDKDTLLSIQ